MPFFVNSVILIRDYIYVLLISKKAYDKVWQGALMLKVLNLGIRGNFFGTIREIYEDCKA